MQLSLEGLGEGKDAEFDTASIDSARWRVELQDVPVRGWFP